MRVCIVGGSIAGATAAIELHRAGHEVAVIERSRGGLTGRGAGIGTPTETFEALVARDLIGEDTPRSSVTGMPLVGRRNGDDRYGHRALTLPLAMTLLNWGDLWAQLRVRVPDDVYVGGREVTGATPRGAGVLLSAADGWSDTYDLALFADGYQSMGRRLLFPDAEPAYRGYVLWRGVLDETLLDESGPLENALYRLHYKGLAGNAVFYFVPGSDGRVDAGHRRVNWACYFPVSGEELAEFLIDGEGRQRAHSLPPGSMRTSEEERLKALMAEHLPGYFSDIVSASHDTFAQPIYAGLVPAYARDRIVLLGDAGAVAPPFTGSGVFKAMMNATDLADALAVAGDPDDALRRWSDEQTERGARLAALGEQMETAFVWDAPDLSSMNEPEARDWWTRSITFPEDFTYVAEDEQYPERGPAGA